MQFAEAGIYLPTDVNIAVSDEGSNFRDVAVAKPSLAPQVAGPVVSVLVADTPGVTGRWVRVTAHNVGVVPRGLPAGGTRAWLFADEMIVNPEMAQ